MNRPYQFVEPAESGRLASLRRAVAQLPGDKTPAGRQVASFIIMDKLHEYVRQARIEFETSLGIKLCQEYCCCKRSTPLVSRMEAEWMVSSIGGKPELLDLSERWLLDTFEGVTTLPADQPALLGGTAQMTSELALEARRLQAMRSPFHVGNADHHERIQNGPRLITSGTNASLLGDMEPLACQAFGLFKGEPEWCWRPSGIGETDNYRALADHTSVMAYAKVLWDFFSKDPIRGQGGFLPTMLMAAGRPKRLQQLVSQGRVAHAKLMLVKQFGFNKWPMQLWEEANGGTLSRVS